MGGSEVRQIVLILLLAAPALALAGITIDGPASGGVEVTCDLPPDQLRKNVGGADGAGLCVFTSIEYAARWQNEKRLVNLQDNMRSEPGGGWPEKVDDMMTKYGKGVRYGQYVGADLTVLDQILATVRGSGVTYNGQDPHYGAGRKVAHMVFLVYRGKDRACIRDNNYIGPRDLVWMSRDEFQTRWTGGRQGWVVFLLSPPPPPVPSNNGDK